jgi:hypothetical protein
MRLPWKKFSDKQLDLLGGDAVAPAPIRPQAKINGDDKRDPNASSEPLRAERVVDGARGQPLILPISALEGRSRQPTHRVLRIRARRTRRRHPPARHPAAHQSGAA